MAERIYRTKRVYRTNFRKLPKGADFWLASNLATTSQDKADRNHTIGGWNTSTGAATLTLVADTSVAVVPVPRKFLGVNWNST
jgi:hypothetical protein